MKVVAASIVISHCEHQEFNAVHHARLKYILEKLVVHDSTSRLDFDHDISIFAKGIGIKKFVDVVVQAKQHWYENFSPLGFPRLNRESQRFKPRAEEPQSAVAVQCVFCASLSRCEMP